MEKDFDTCRIGLISWPIGYLTPRKHSDTYIKLGEIYDKKIKNKKSLFEFHNNLRYLYPFKASKNGDKVTIHNVEDFTVFRLRYKLTFQTSLFNYTSDSDSDYESDEVIKFKSPCLYDLSCMTPLFKEKVKKTLIPSNDSDHCRVFIVTPYNNPIIRGRILDSCISLIKNHNYLFILIGDRYGNNKESSSNLMSRYLSSRGSNKDNIFKNDFDQFPDSIVESAVFLSVIINTIRHITFDVFFACSSMDIHKVMCFVRDNSEVIDNICNYESKYQFICET